MINLKYIPQTKLEVAKKGETNFVLSFCSPEKIELSYSKGITIIQQNTGFKRIKLEIQADGQTQFNIFNPPLSGEHWLIVNGIEEYSPYAYEVQNISGNWRIVWKNANYQLKTTMELIFVTQNI